MARLLVIIGSGETAPTMVTVHQQVFERLSRADRALVLDTPYGFQENAADLSARTQEYFRRNVGREVEVAAWKRTSDLTQAQQEERLLAVATADWLFAGPGSPTYALRQWRQCGMREALQERLAGAGATVFASAAAAALGRCAIPVYEIYKAGIDPYWEDGLDLLTDVGLPATVVPHFDNAEGGTHDTRFCYLGGRRLAQLEAALPDGTWILGVDEHTAVILDLDAETATVMGRGRLTVRSAAHQVSWAAGASAAFADLRAAASGRAPAAAPREAQARTEPSRPSAATPFVEQMTGLVDRFDTALRAGRPVDAVAHALELEQAIADWASDTDMNDETDRARSRLRRMLTRLGQVADAGLHDHGELIAPLVDGLLELRTRAREEQRFEDADALRDLLVDAGIDVHDTPDGTHWHYIGTNDAIELAVGPAHVRELAGRRRGREELG